MWESGGIAPCILAEQVDSGGTASDLYSGGTRFEFLAGAVSEMFRDIPQSLCANAGMVR
jgi:hypothetical protein